MLCLRNEFPLLRNNNDLLYLDCAATSPIPDAVVSSWLKYQSEIGVSIGRGSNRLTHKAEEIYHESVKRISNFFSCESDYDLIFTKNATEASNMLAYSFKDIFHPGDVILLSEYEHHSNLLPWRRVAIKTGAQIVMIPLQPDGALDYTIIDLIPTKRIKLAALSLISNVNGHILMLGEIRKKLPRNAMIILDIAQAAGHMELNLSDINASAYIVSAHKMYAPKNIGACILKKDLCNQVEPFHLGGGMVDNAIGEKKSWKKRAEKFHAGTFDVGLIRSWATACHYITNIGWHNIIEHEKEIMECVKKVLTKYTTLHILPTNNPKATLCSFYDDNIHAHDFGRTLDKHGIIIRTGDMCAQHTINAFGKTNVSRISCGLYNDVSDTVALDNVLSGIFGKATI